MNLFYATHQGLRANNEDRYLAMHLDGGAALMAVADGMGGHVAGELAARIAVESLANMNLSPQATEADLVESVKASRRRIAGLAVKDPALAGMGTTLTAAFVSKQAAHWVHVGDSRLSLFRESQLVEVTEDHTIPGLLLRQGQISKAAARIHPMRNVLLNCIGPGGLEVDSGTFELREGDVLVLSTDGLHDVVAEERITSILRSNIGMQAKLDLLIDEALASGGRDNVTVLALEV